MADTATADELLKEVYGPGVIELLPTQVKTLRRFEDQSASASWMGRSVVRSVHVSRNEGSGWSGERAAIPAAGQQGWTNKRIPMRFQYGRFDISAQAMESAQGDKGSFAPLLEQEQTLLIKDLAAERGRAIFGDGRGVLALFNGDPGTGVTYTVDAPAGVAGAQNGSKFLRPGRVVAAINPATGALRASAVARIATRASTGLTTTITAAAATAIADNDFIVAAANMSVTDANDTSYGKEFMGLLGMVDDGTYVPTFHNVNRTTYPLYGAQVINASGPWSADVVQRGIDIAEERGDGTITDMIMHQSARRAYIAATRDQRQYVGASLMSPNEGTTAATRGSLAFGTIPITTDKYCHLGMIFGIAQDDAGFTRYKMKAGEWVTSEGGNIFRLVGTGSTLTHVYEAVYTIWDNFDIDRPNTCFRIDNLTVTAAVVPVD